MHPADLNIFVMPVVGGDPVQLTHGPRDDFTPHWSPDGRYIASLGDTGRTKLVYLMSPLGGESRLLADTNIPFLERFVETWKSLGEHPWSRDGRELVFSRLDASGRISLWKINIETRQETRLTSPPAGCDDLNGSWSFDAHWIAFTRTQGGLGSLWLVAAGGGEPRLLLRDTNDNNTPAWSMDSRRLVFQSNRHGPQNLWEIEIGSGRLRKITHGAGVDGYPAVGPKGLLYSHHAYNVNLYSVDLDSGLQKQLTNQTGRNYWPRISRDGRQVAYQSDHAGEWDVWLLDLQTGSRTRSTTDAAVDLTPEWVPDGRHISFISNRDGAFRIWVQDVEHGIQAYWESTGSGANNRYPWRRTNRVRAWLVAGRQQNRFYCGPRNDPVDCGTGRRQCAADCIRNLGIQLVSRFKACAVYANFSRWVLYPGAFGQGSG
jgi:TolB protein